jgi:tetrahydromethanopterin S-methyltransferase subunit G
MQEFNKELRFVETEKDRLERTEVYLKEADKYNAIVEKYDKNPFLKGKLLLSKNAKQEYEHAVSKRDYYQDRMKEKGISGKDDWNKQTQTLEKFEARVPFIRSQIQPISRSLGILDALIQGIEQASYAANRAQQQKQLTKGKGKGKGKFKADSMERGYER